jgi:hypothetical protein
MGEWNLEQFVEGHSPETGAMPVHDDRIWVCSSEKLPRPQFADPSPGQDS